MKHQREGGLVDREKIKREIERLYWSLYIDDGRIQTITDYVWRLLQNANADEAEEVDLNEEED